MENIQAAGKGWDPEQVILKSEADFIKDPAHAVDGLSDKDNVTALKGVYAECLKATGKTKKDAEAAK